MKHLGLVLVLCGAAGLAATPDRAQAFDIQGATVTLPDDRVVHVRTGRKYGQVILWLRGRNDVESVYDCYEPFFDFEVEETGERGYGVCEYGFVPRSPMRI